MYLSLFAPPSMAVLRDELNLVIEDFGAKPKLNSHVKSYYNLLRDYMVKRGFGGIVHVREQLRPVLLREG